MNRQVLPAVLLSLAAAIAACGGAALSVGPPWKADDSPFFDDGVDLIENPIALAGSWGARQKNWMEGRIQLADVVAVVEVRAVQTEIDASKIESKRLDITVVKTLYGEAPSTKMMLVSRADSPGFPLITRHEARLGGRLLLFYRHFEVQGDDGNRETGHHFHLSPASEILLTHVSERLKFRIEAEAK